MIDIPVTLTEVAAKLRAGEFTSVELTEAVLVRADAIDPLIGCYVKRFDDTALTQAAKADADFAAGVDHGAMQGIPVGVKDILADADGPTTAQSLILDPEWGAGKDAPVVARLKAAGAVITGKLTTMEFACGMPDATKPFPLPRNPWDTDTWPGGSSSGSGNGVAAGLVFAGIGTDTGGSIRIPAAFCGVSGLMPTFGRVPKSGCTPLGYSLDHIGPLARSARDCAAMLDAIAGYHPSDPDSSDTPVPEFLAGLEGFDGSLAGVRIGVDRVNTFGPGTDPALAEVFDAALEALVAQGATLVEISLPYFAEMAAVCRITMMGEAFSYHGNDLRSRWGEYFAATRQMISRGAFVNAADFVQAQRVRRVVQRDLLAMLAGVDAIATPTAGTTSIRYEAFEGELPVDMLKAFGLVYTGYWDPMGCPAIVLPMGFNAEGMPLSLQFGGRPFDEAGLLKIADAFQQATEWHLQLPPLLSELQPA